MAEPYRILVTGSRSWANRDLIRQCLAGIARDHPGRSFLLLHGMCDPRLSANGEPIPWGVAVRLAAEHQDVLTGADWIADRAARELGWQVRMHPADWAAFGGGAGPRRNAEMVAAGADECLAFPLPGSRGTLHCARLAEKAGIPTRRYEDNG
jgi:hypothetical protein